MRQLIYHVAMTLDNYIAYEDGSSAGFSAFAEGEHVTDYFADLKKYDTVIMGRATYEFGYQFGLVPGQPAYEGVKHYIFSKSLRFDTKPDPLVEIVRSNELDFVKQLKDAEGSDIYLCGGAAFACFLFENELVDLVKIKLYPLIFGSGLRLFGTSRRAVALSLLDSKVYSNGALLLTYKIDYRS